MDIHGSTRKLIPLRQVSTSTKQYLIRIALCLFQLNILIAFVRLWFTCINGKAWWNLEKNYRLLRYHGKSVYLELSPAVAFSLFASVIHAKPVRDLILLDWPDQQSNKLEMRFCRGESGAGPEFVATLLTAGSRVISGQRMVDQQLVKQFRRHPQVLSLNFYMSEFQAESKKIPLLTPGQSICKEIGPSHE
jgi:hypothetical protein